MSSRAAWLWGLAMVLMVVIVLAFIGEGAYSDHLGIRSCSGYDDTLQPGETITLSCPAAQEGR